MVYEDVLEDLSLLDGEEITLFVFGALNLLFTSSFIFSYINVFRHKIDYSEIPTVAISFCYLNDLVWYYYSDLRYHDYMRICTQISTWICFIYLLVFLKYEIKEDKIDAFLNTGIIVTASWAVKKLLIDILNDEDKVKICGAYSNIALLISMLEWLISSYKIKDINLLNIFSAFSLAFVSICGITFGVLYDELSILISNVLGLIVSCIYIGIWYYLKKKFSNIANDKKNNIDDMEIKKENIENTKNTTKISEDDEKETLKKKE